MSIVDEVYSNIPLNTVEIAPSDLNITHKVRSNPLPWNGQFSPQLVQVLLKQYGSPNTKVFDPFLGSGTTLLEAGLLGCAACGTEINPAAVNLANIYRFVNVHPDHRVSYLSLLSALLEEHFLIDLPLFSGTQCKHNYREPESLRSSLISLWQSVKEPFLRYLLSTLMVLGDLHKPEATTENVFRAWKKIQDIVISLPFSSNPLDVWHTDARNTPLTDSSVDLVLTSPPYINVFNYHQQYRASMESLKWDLLKVAKSEIGSNRKHRGNRFLTVIQFCLDIAQVLQEIARVCISNGRVILVVGRESMVRGVAFYNGAIVAEIAHAVLGCTLAMRQERVFINRFGQSIFEDILHFFPDHTYQHTASSLLDIARKIAQKTLESSYEGASMAVRPDIARALAMIQQVSPSPLFDGNVFAVS